MGKEIKIDSTLQRIQKLNEDLTAENTKLLKQVDLWKSYKDENLKLKNDLELETHFKCCEREKVKDLDKKLTVEIQLLNQEKSFHRETKGDLNAAILVGAEYLTELQKIKSTRLYKFFKWLGVW